MTIHHVSISDRLPSWTKKAVALFLLVAIGVAWFVYTERERLVAAMCQSDVVSFLLAREQESNIFDKENRRLTRENNMLETTLKVEQDTIKDIMERMVSSERKALELRQELEFYKHIVDDAGDAAGLAIQGIHIEAHGDRRYRFLLVLTNLKRSETVTGEVRLVVAGTLDGATVKRDARDFFVKTLDLSYQFKHFKWYEGLIELPANFEPNKMIVSLVRPGKNTPVVAERIFDWPQPDVDTALQGRQ